MMKKPAYEDFGITKDEFEAIFAKKNKIRDYTFGISSAVGIIAGCVYGLYLATTLYETFLFILFFGCFLGSLFGGFFTMFLVAFYRLFLSMCSPSYRSCKQYIAAKDKISSETE